MRRPSRNSKRLNRPDNKTYNKSNKGKNNSSISSRRKLQDKNNNNSFKLLLCRCTKLQSSNKLLVSLLDQLKNSLRSRIFKRVVLSSKTFRCRVSSNKFSKMFLTWLKLLTLVETKITIWNIT